MKLFECLTCYKFLKRSCLLSLCRLPQLHQPVEIIGTFYRVLHQIRHSVLVVHKNHNQRFQCTPDKGRNLTPDELDDVGEHSAKLVPIAFDADATTCSQTIRHLDKYCRWV